MLNFMNRGALREEASGEGEGGGAFDPAKFKTELMTEVTTMLNGGIGRIEKQLKALKPAPAGEGAGGGEGQGGGEGEGEGQGGKKVDPEVVKTRKQLEQLQAKFETSEKSRLATESAAKEKERLSLIRTELAKQGLADHAVDDAFRFFRDEVKFTEDGTLVGGSDEKPLAEYVKEVVEQRTHWLPPKSNAGAGAGPGNGRGRTNGVSLDDIKPGMKPEQSAAAREGILAVLNGR